MKRGLSMLNFLLFILIVIALVGLFIRHGYKENRRLVVETLKLSGKRLPQTLPHLTIMHLSDLHFSRLRVSQEKIIRAVVEAKPSYIFISGDTIDRTADLKKVPLVSFLNQLAAIAPTFVVSGNHETSSGQYKKWMQLVESSHAELLKNEVVVVPFDQTHITISGFLEGHHTLSNDQKEKLKFSSLNLLLAHHPEKFLEHMEAFAPFPLDAIFSGHAHGGQIRIPGLGGLLAPNQGLLPYYTDGAYQVNERPETTLFVSRGLGNSRFPFRINNKPVLLKVTIKGTLK